jgi:hypothetical protein
VNAVDSIADVVKRCAAGAMSLEAARDELADLVRRYPDRAAAVALIAEAEPVLTLIEAKKVNSGMSPQKVNLR